MNTRIIRIDWLLIQDVNHLVRMEKNIFHLYSSIENPFYPAPVFTIKADEDEVVRYKKTRIMFNSLHFTNPSSWRTRELDSINFVNLCFANKH